ncbi:MAG: PQQ-like beta-propeller repeat protein [Spirochaetes bacterium]|nr:PQQ-like beta-propeller repeat protein [Spirochaetota bacterium]
MKILLYRLTAPGLLVAAVLLAGCPQPGPVKDTSEWTISSSAPFVSQPVAMGPTVLAVDFHGRLFSVNPLTGKKNWTYETGERVVFSPVVDAAGDIFIHTGTDFIIKLRQNADASGVSRLWSTEDQPGELARTATDAMYLIGDTIYRYNSHCEQLSAFNAESGELIARYDIPRFTEGEGRYVWYLYPLGSIDMDFLLIWNDGVYAPYKDGLELADFVVELNPAMNESFTGELISYFMFGRPFVHADRAWVLLQSTTYVWDPINELAVPAFDAEGPLPSKLWLYRIDPDGIDLAGDDPLARHEISADSPFSNFMYPGEDQWLSGNIFRMYIPEYPEPIIASLDLTTYSLDFVSLPSPTDLLPGSSGSVYEIIPLDGGDLFLQMQFINDDSPFMEHSWYMYCIPGALSLNGPDEPEQLFQLIPNVLAPALITEGSAVVPYAENTLRGYSHSYGAAGGLLRGLQTAESTEVLP